MRTEPAYNYVCEYCGRAFENAYECERHERECKEKVMRRRNCQRCGGKGYIYGSWEEDVWVEPKSIMSDGHWERKIRYGNVPCPRCNNG